MNLQTVPSRKNEARRLPVMPRLVCVLENELLTPQPQLRPGEPRRPRTSLAAKPALARFTRCQPWTFSASVLRPFLPCPCSPASPLERGHWELEGCGELLPGGSPTATALLQASPLACACFCRPALTASRPCEVPLAWATLL